MLAAFLTTILFSISAITANRAAKILGGAEANFWRLLAATLFLGLMVHGFGHPTSVSAFPTFLLSGLIGFGLGDLAMFQSLARLGSRLTIMIVQCLAAPLAAYMEWVWMGTTLTPSQMAGSATILVGVALALAPSSSAVTSTHTLAERRIGCWWGIAAAIGQALGAVLSRKAYDIARLAGEPVDGISAAYERILGGVALVAVWLWFQQRKERSTLPPETAALSMKEKWRRSWLMVIVNSLAGPAIGVSCYQWALKTTPTGIVLPIVATTPLVIIPFAIAFEGERLEMRSVFGGVVAVVGAVALVW